MKASPPRPPPSRWGGLVLSFGTVVLCLVLAEGVLRIRSPTGSLWRFPNYVSDVGPPDAGDAQLRYDSELGWEPIPGYSGLLFGRPMSFSKDGLRNHNLGTAPAAGPLILVLGDSYSEGYAVGDDETWPAHFARDTGQRVLNAAVRSYGLDQVVLRAERLAPLLEPSTFVLAFTASNIGRTELSAIGGKGKPYFVPEGEGLALRNVPVPVGSGSTTRSRVKSVLGRSLLVGAVLRRLGAADFLYGDATWTGAESGLVSCRLMGRFARLVRKQGARALVVGLPEHNGETDPAGEAIMYRRVAAALSCAAKVGLATLDTYAGFEKAGAKNDLESFYKLRHFTARGNALAARLIADALAAGHR